MEALLQLLQDNLGAVSAWLLGMGVISVFLAKFEAILDAVIAFLVSIKDAITDKSVSFAEVKAVYEKLKEIAKAAKK